jgi:hypothetical protein
MGNSQTSGPSNANAGARISRGSASIAFAPYRRHTLRMARSRSTAAFSTAWRRTPELGRLAEHDAVVVLLSERSYSIPSLALVRIAAVGRCGADS